jgi:DNA-binding MarR family transcriptional regulator
MPQRKSPIIFSKVIHRVPARTQTANTMISHTEPELAILEGIGEAEQGGLRVTQRELARKAGLSLGMTNALLRQFAERGWVKLTKLSTRSVVYALTPDGVAEIAHRTAGYFRRASRNSERYRDRLEAYIMGAKESGASTVVLAGSSDLEFLLEYLCERHGLVFVKSADLERARTLGRKPGVVIVLAERSEPVSIDGTPALFSLDPGYASPLKTS